ncbi:MAG: V-type ATP synthase subunit D [Magnetococcales bacterium]|nr:V-type ATP synthase subunit D [Magnetococcales bacterium]
MARLAMNKSSLADQNKQLKVFEEYLPALDLKRKQLIMERNRMRQALNAIQNEEHVLLQTVCNELPMLTTPRMVMTELVTISDVEMQEENLLGLRLPVLHNVSFTIADYPLLATPHWIEPLIHYLKQALTLRLRIRVAEQRQKLIRQAVRVITQRVNLFEKVLIPRTRDNIRRIQIYLADAQRVEVVQAKIAKRKREVVA